MKKIDFEQNDLDLLTSHLPRNETAHDVDGQNPQGDQDDTGAGERPPPLLARQLADVHGVDGALHAHGQAHQKSSTQKTFKVLYSSE